MEGIGPVEQEVRRLIEVAGPMPVSEYMALCLSHPQHGYYMTRDPFGSGGDFTTAPEISQMFGELIGLWTAAVWRSMGSPTQLRLVELGPGRGTLMADALRAARVMPGFQAALALHLVEISPALKQRQQQTLGTLEIPLHWHDSLEQVPDGPVIVIANEFFDALPVHQAVKLETGWHERVVETDVDGSLVFGTAAEPIPHFERILPPTVRSAPEGALFEWRSDATALALGRRVCRGPGAALVIDYGHTVSDIGDTLQAVGKHNFADPLDTPGELDLTAHVDFQALAQAAESIGAALHGPVEQGPFLRHLGIESRAAVLKQHASDKTSEIDGALRRLTDPGEHGMGRLFKVLGLSDPKLAALPGFDR
jgi:NADH dehydrogenase [ubiquinone] 1 alpha subcomplex assembly factor 7